MPTVVRSTHAERLVVRCYSETATVKTSDSDALAFDPPS